MHVSCGKWRLMAALRKRVPSSTRCCQHCITILRERVLSKDVSRWPSGLEIQGLDAGVRILRVNEPITTMMLVSFRGEGTFTEGGKGSWGDLWPWKTRCKSCTDTLRLLHASRKHQKSRFPTDTLDLHEKKRLSMWFDQASMSMFMKELEDVSLKTPNSCHASPQIN